jgi:hypothetical protein
MDRPQQDLWINLRGFSFDEPGTVLTFEAKLARLHGWSLVYTRRVIQEYRRFLLLAATAEVVVSPSEQVDQAWHLHLTFTRNYWSSLCEQVIGRPLHHEPSRGGPDEQRKYRGLYQQTLTLYERVFGHPPPSDIWSDVETRFGHDLGLQMVNRNDYWLIPKPRWPSRRQVAAEPPKEIAEPC